jgi:hypothetical protein
MPTIPTWLTGRNVTTLTLTPQSNVDGVLSDSTPVAAIFGHIDEVTLTGSKTSENIKPLNTIRRNMVPIDVGTRITMAEILKAGGTNLLAQAWFGANEYFKISLARGAQTFTFYGLFHDYEEQLRQGKSVGVATFEMVDPAVANPAYAPL